MIKWIAAIDGRIMRIVAIGINCALWYGLYLFVMALWPS